MISLFSKKNPIDNTDMLIINLVSVGDLNSNQLSQKPLNHSGIKPAIDFFFLLPSLLLLIEQKSCWHKDHSGSATLLVDNNIDKQTAKNTKRRPRTKNCVEERKTHAVQV